MAKTWTAYSQTVRKGSASQPAFAVFFRFGAEPSRSKYRTKSSRPSETAEYCTGTGNCRLCDTTANYGDASACTDSSYSGTGSATNTPTTLARLKLGGLCTTVTGIALSKCLPPQFLKCRPQAVKLFDGVRCDRR